MADKKYDWSETDRVMDELRRQLAAEHELIAGMTAPGIADVLAASSAVPTVDEELPVEAAAPDDPAAVLAAHTVPDAPEEMPAADMDDAKAPDGEVPTAEAPDEAVTDDVSTADARTADEPADIVDAETTADEIAVADLPAADASERKKRRRKRVPRLADIAEQSQEAPLFEEARESARRRAAELAAREESDLFWRHTPKGRVSRRTGAVTVSFGEAPVAEPSVPVVEPSAVAEPPAVAVPVAEPVAEAPIPTALPEITQMEIPLDLPVTESEGDALPRARRTKRVAVPVTEVEQLTVEGLLSDIFGNDAFWSEPESAAESIADEGEALADGPHTEVTQVTRVRRPDEPIIEIDGKLLELPDEQALAESAKRRADKRAEEADKSPDLSEAEGAQSPAADDALPDEEHVKLFSAFSVRRNKEGALPKPSISRMSAEQVAFKRKLESSEADFKLLVDLDYEDELGDAIGFEKIREYHERVVNGQTRETAGARARERGENQQFFCQAASPSHHQSGSQPCDDGAALCFRAFCRSAAAFRCTVCRLCVCACVCCNGARILPCRRDTAAKAAC